ncbi:MAG: SEC-C metal-binding domain-containing protein [Halomonas sp.]
MLSSCDACPCGSGLAYEACCAPCHRGDPVVTRLKPGRNDPCSCGSGRKLKGGLRPAVMP